MSNVELAAAAKAAGKTRFANNTQMAAAAKAAGKTRFSSVCKRHGAGDFWAASKRCVRCAAESKTPEIQAAYWEKNRAAIAAKRKAKNNPCNPSLQGLYSAHG